MKIKSFQASHPAAELEPPNRLRARRKTPVRLADAVEIAGEKPQGPGE
jgi:hypothetical protein